MADRQLISFLLLFLCVAVHSSIWPPMVDCAGSLAAFYVARVISGIGVGMATVIIPSKQ